MSEDLKLKSQPGDKAPQKIFISHSHKDQELVQRFIDSVLGIAFGVDLDRVVASSVEGNRFGAGVSIRNGIRSEIHESALYIAIITPTFLESDYCRVELGAAWAVLDEGRTIPVVVPPLSRGDVPVLGRDNIVLNLANVEDIIHLFESLERAQPNFWSSEKPSVSRLANRASQFAEWVPKWSELAYSKKPSSGKTNQQQTNSILDREGDYKVVEKGNRVSDEYNCQVLIDEGNAKTGPEVRFRNFYNMRAQGVSDDIKGIPDGDSIIIQNQEIKGLAFEGIGHWKSEKELEIYFKVMQGGEEELNHAVYRKV